MTTAIEPANPSQWFVEEAHGREQSGEQYRLLADSLPGGVFTCQFDGTCDYCNQWFCNYTGMAADQALGSGWAAAIHPDDRDQALDVWKEALRIRGVFQTEIRFRHADGYYHWFLVRAVPLNDERGQIIKWFGTCTDIEDHKRIAAERDKYLSRLQLQIERMPLAYILLDADLQIIDWNPAANRIFGYTKAEVLGMGPPFEKILPAELRPLSEELLRRMRSGDMTAHSVNDNLTRNGNIITCEWFNTPLFAEDGRFSGLMCLAQDITERKTLEEQFRQAQKMEAIGKLAAGVAHDFNNLLTVINGYSDLLLEKSTLDDATRSMVTEIQEAGERSVSLTRQLLAFSRKQVLAPEVLNLNRVVIDMNRMLRRIIGEDIELMTVLQEDLGSIKADSGQIEQVILNLAVNARDAMPKGGTLTIETRNTWVVNTGSSEKSAVPLGSCVLLVVSDTGCGMTPGVMTRIFEPFFTTKRAGKGTGLGLATVFGIVQQSGGHIAVESKPDVGSAFYLYLPRTSEPVGPERPRVNMGRVPRGGETVMIVEDEEAVRTLTKYVLQTSGYTVLEAADVDAAVRFAEQHCGPIDLLVSDVVMPKLGGRELAELLVALRPQMKVLFLSGYTDDAVVRQGILREEVNFLQKPFRSAALALKVREVLDRYEKKPCSNRTNERHEGSSGTK